MLHRSRKSATIPEPARSEYWAPYSDMMAAMVGVFILLLIATLYHLGKPLQEVEKALRTRSELAELIMSRIEQDTTLVDISKSGVITFRGDILFDVDDSSLSESGKALLSAVMPPILGSVFDGDSGDSLSFENQLSRIMIEGHADSTFSPALHPEFAGYAEAGYQYNLDLSQRRAFSVMNYLLNDPSIELVLREKLKRYATASGRSFVDPRADDLGQYSPGRSRRIEIKFQTKDKELLESLVGMLRQRLQRGEL